MLLFPAQVKPLGVNTGSSDDVMSTQGEENVTGNANNNLVATLVGIATASATVCEYLTNGPMHTSAVPFGLAVLVAVVGLTTWNLARGGTAALGKLKLTGRRKSARPRASRSAEASTHRPSPPAKAENPPTLATARPTSHRGAGTTTVIVLLLAGVIAWVYVPSGQPAVAATGRVPRRVTISATPQSAVYAYYAAVNDREWSKAWALVGQPDAIGSAAYYRWADGYNCTVRDQITGIATRGTTVLVTVRAQESGGLTQSYRFSYVVRSGVLTRPQILSFAGRAPGKHSGPLPGF